jgi:putative photosynthetic complex assembly protein 2
MLTYGLPIAATLFIWWFSTGAILFLDGLPKRTFRWSMMGASVLALLALYGLIVSRADQTVAGVYTAFVSAMMIWAWNEMAFLMGYLTGSRRESCPIEAKGFRRFVFASQSILHHELAIVISGGIILALTWGVENAFGFWTFFLLWAMRLSTKLNIFFGVPNTTVDFLPPHLAYLKSYFSIKPMNLLFPVSITVSTIVAVQMVGHVLMAPSGSGVATGHILLITLMVLAIIEHWFLVIPLPFGDLWSWGLASRKTETSMSDFNVIGVNEAAVQALSKPMASQAVKSTGAQAFPALGHK